MVDLSIPTETRWYSHNKCLLNLLSNKAVLLLLLETPLVRDHKPAHQMEQLVVTVSNQTFWSDTGRLTEILSIPCHTISLLESYQGTLELVHESFIKMKKDYSNLQLEQELLADVLSVVEYRWNFIHTESMGWSYLLSPKHLEINEMEGAEYRDTIIQLNHFISVVYQEEQALSCKKELKQYLGQLEYLADDAKSEITSCSSSEYWSVLGRKEYPLLSKLALRMNAVPTSSAASERVWKVFSFIHNKRRSRLLTDTIEKLAFVYINSALLDPKDQADYFDIGIYSDDDSA